MSSIKVPGVVWVMLLTAVIAFITANFENAVWYNVTVVVLTAILKSLQVAGEPETPTAPTDPNAPMASRMAAPPQPSRLVRWLLG